MNWIGRWAVAVAMMSAVSPAGASDQSGRVTYVAQTGSRFLFGLSGSRSSRPGCDCCNRWEIVVNSIDAQSRVAAIMTAFATGKTTQIGGTGACAVGSNDTEEVGYLQVNA